MKKSSKDSSFEVLEKMNQLKVAIELSNIERQQKQIKECSPYSATINDCILTYDELLFYHSLDLKEALVTRKALIREN